jgi:hypothetical protein
MTEKAHTVVGVFSCVKAEERRNRMRELWVSRADYYNVRVLFVVGVGRTLQTPLLIEDTLFCPCPDTYNELPQKTAALIDYALDVFDFEYLFKTDDDTFLRVDRLATMPAGDYVGYCLNAGNGPFAHGGPGYRLSRRACLLASPRMRKSTVGGEDCILGGILRASGVELVHEPRLRPNWDTVKYPRPDNDLISVHNVRNDRQSALLKQVWELV